MKCLQHVAGQRCPDLPRDLLMKTGWPEIFPLLSLPAHLHKGTTDVQFKDTKYKRVGEGIEWAFFPENCNHIMVKEGKKHEEAAHFKPTVKELSQWLCLCFFTTLGQAPYVNEHCLHVSSPLELHQLLLIKAQYVKLNHLPDVFIYQFLFFT